MKTILYGVTTTPSQAPAISLTIEFRTLADWIRSGDVAVSLERTSRAAKKLNILLEAQGLRLPPPAQIAPGGGDRVILARMHGDALRLHTWTIGL